MRDEIHLTRTAALVAMLGLAVMTNGCTSYYAVTDPKTGKQYYTTEWQTARGGTTRFVDARSGAIVTIQESEIREINEKEFQQNTGKN
ncbi:MAG: hypothetical protein ABSG14_15175 [Verrucomicrobiia bacterium]|jgi:uncharacterized protein YceK